MTEKEYEVALYRMSDIELKKFNEDFSPGSREDLLRAFPDIIDVHERRLCQLLGLKTQDEKKVEAAMSNAKYAKIALFLSIIAILVSILAIFSDISLSF